MGFYGKKKSGRICEGVLEFSGLKKGSVIESGARVRTWMLYEQIKGSVEMV